MPSYALRIQSSLKNRITLLVSALVLIGIWGLAVSLAAVLQANLEKAIAQKLETTVDYATRHIDQEVQLRIDALQQAAPALAASMQLDRAGVQHRLERSPYLPAIFPGGLVVIDRDGVVVADRPARPGRLGARFGQHDYFHTAMQLGKPVLGVPKIGEEPEAGTITALAVPLHAPDGALTGVLAAPVHLQDDDLLGVLEETPLGRGGNFIVASPDERLIVGASEHQRLLERLPEPGVDPLWDRRLTDGFEGAAITVSPAGVEMLQVCSTMQTTGWLILASVPTEEAFAPIAPLKRQMYLGALAMTVLIALLLRIALGRQLAPLIEAGEAMRRMSEGDAPFAPIPAARDDEIGCLIRNFNRLAVDRNRLDASLRQSEKRFRDIVNSTDGIVWEAELPSCTFTFVSAQAERLLGYPVEDWKRPGFWIEHLHPDDCELASAYCAERTNSPQTDELEYRFIARDGGIVWVRNLVTVVNEDSTPRWLRGIMIDITERKRTEEELLRAKAEAERANNAKSRFLAAASHDLRQPLAALNLYVGILACKLPPADRSLSTSIADCVASLSEMLNDLLDLSKLEAGVVTPEVTDFSLAKVLTNLVATHAPEADAKGLELHCMAHDVTARTDPVLFARALGNLVSNAIRYTTTGGVLVGCRRRDGRLWVEVWDTGIGIPADKTGEIFEEFRQLDNEARDRNKGSGLGLAIVAKAAALLGLRIRVRSRVGKGSMFALEVPPGHAVRTEAPRTFTHRPLRIALVEDDALVIDALTYALAEVGHEIYAAATSAELLVRLAGDAPDIVISDYRLAGGEIGFDVVTAVRTAFRDTLPALVITGDTDPQLMRKMAHRGIRVLHKPVELGALQRVIAELTDESAPERPEPRPAAP